MKINYKLLKYGYEKIDKDEFKEIYALKQNYVNEIIDETIDSYFKPQRQYTSSTFLKAPKDSSSEVADRVSNILFESMKYSVKAGGKRIRPIFLAESYSLFAKHPNKHLVERFMCAIEMIHTYSLVHDDLPEMDNDVLRRGMPTTHVKFGHAEAVLAGDALLTDAFLLMTKTTYLSNKYKIRAIEAANYLAECAGSLGMVKGQSLDIELSKDIYSQTEYEGVKALLIEELVNGKTCGLIRAALVCGGILGGASDIDITMLEGIGDNIGLAFQIQDDILDFTSTTEELGKTVGKDEQENKTTYVSVLGIERAKKIADDCLKEAVNMLEGLPGNTLFLYYMILMLAERTK